MSDEIEIRRIERLERTVNALRNYLLLLYDDTEDLAYEITKPLDRRNVERVAEKIERNREILKSLREIDTA